MLRAVEGYGLVGPHLCGPDSQACVFCGASLAGEDEAERGAVSPRSGVPNQTASRCVPWKHVDESVAAYRDRLVRGGYALSAHFLDSRTDDIAKWEIAAHGGLNRF